MKMSERTYQPVSQSVSQSVNQSDSQSVGQSVSRSVSQSVSQSEDGKFSWSVILTLSGRWITHTVDLSGITKIKRYLYGKRENGRRKLSISQNRKWADKNSAPKTNRPLVRLQLILGIYKKSTNKAVFEDLSPDCEPVSPSCLSASSHL